MLIYILIATVLTSFVSLVWIVFLWAKQKTLNIVSKFLVSMAVWALLWDVFLHILPEIVEEKWLSIYISWLILAGIVAMFIVEKFFHRRHCHCWSWHHHTLVSMNLIGDSIHNFIDWLIIWWSFMISPSVGVATTIAVMLHEIPQELADFWIMISSWLSKKRALFLNFVISLSAVFWWVLIFYMTDFFTGLIPMISAFAMWSFLYIAWTDLIPELHKHSDIKTSLMQLFFMLLGIWLMSLLLFLE
jgi:zinc and cadmium transporter